MPYRIDPIAPFVGNDDFTRLSPLRRIPVLIDGDLVLNDSSVICQYLEDRHPGPPLYPADIADRARARWMEEYADSHLGDVLVWNLFYQLGAKRHIFKEAPDEALVQHAREVGIPAALDYLERQLPADGFIFGDAVDRRHFPRQLLPHRRASCAMRSMPSAGRARPRWWSGSGTAGDAETGQRSRTASCACRWTSSAMCLPLRAWP